MPVLRLVCVIYLLMLPVTGMVPVLHDLTVGRHPETGDLARHLFMSVNMIGALVAAPLAGLASDGLGRRVPLIAGALLVNGFALLLIAGDWSYPVILALRFVEGCAHMSALSLLMALGADHGRRHGMGAAMGAVGAAVSLGVASGAPLGGWIGAAAAAQVPWLGGWLMLALAAAAPLLLRDAPHAAARQSPARLLRELAARRMLAVPYLFTFVDRLTVGFIVSTFALYLGAVLEFDARRIGLVMAAFMIPFALLTYPAGRLCQHWDRLGMMIVGSVLYGLFLIALGLAPAGALVALMAGGGVVAALMYAPSLVLAAELAGPGQRASTLAGFNVAGSLGFALGPLLGGTLVGGFRSAGLDPYLPVFFIVGALEILIALAVLPLWRRGVGRQPAALRAESPPHAG
ncbi:MFS transporter [Pseudothauera rhizosphaerae]|uniref:MFS transporter n=1 Tax=Pseudothauera rhizosphaerae TaxID=2565932 RepID=A0A4S4AVX7_9RHOO|nr:MFS transporter [Pseudothauera rhizosphaerae]THF64131.1 MFS transporter [Pseudothauera rhizosphaerae]